MIQKARKPLCTILLVFNALLSFSQFTGITTISDDATKQRTKFNNAEEFNAFLNNKIFEYQANGFVNAAIDSLIDYNDSAKAIIYRGKQFYWNDFQLQNTENYNFKLPKFKYRKGSPVNLHRIKRHQTKITNTFENNGYPFISLIPHTIIEDSLLTLTLIPESGEQYRFDSLVFNKFKISKNFLSGYLNIKYDEIYNEEIFQKIPQKIDQLAFLQLKANPTVSFGNKLARTQLNIETKKSNYFNGLIGIVPDPDKENKYLITGDVDLTLNNAIGRGEHLKLNWKKNDRFSQELDGILKWPYIFRLPLGFEGQISMLKQDTSYVDIESRTGLFIFFNGSNTAAGYYKNSQTIVLTPIDSTNIQKTNTYGSGITLTLRKQDNYLNPAKGYEFEIDMSGGRRNTFDSLNQEIKAGYIDGHIKAEGFIPIYKNWTINLKHVYAGLYSDKKLFLNEYIRTGGLKSFRGFDENEFLSTSYNASTIELRWLFENLSHFKIFTDIGAFKTKTNNKTIINKAVGIGTGLNLHTNAGIFSISYALGRYHNTQFRLNNAKIHFGYINSF